MDELTAELVSEPLESALRGAVYGAKIRGPHALVMALVFGRHSPRRLARGVLRATASHSRRLAVFALCYKLLHGALARALGQARSRAGAFVAGCACGAYVWGDDTPINTQLNLYLLARVLVGLTRAGAARAGVGGGKAWFRLWSAAMWGAVMCMFEADSLHRHMQPSLVSSMKYIYEPREHAASAADVARGGGARGAATDGEGRLVELRDVVPTALVWLVNALLARRADAERARLRG